MRKIVEKYLISQTELAPGLVISEDTSTVDAVQMMREKKTGCAVTMNGTQVTGIFTERDVLNKLVGQSPDLWAKPIRNFTTKNPVTMKVTEPLKKAVSAMCRKRFRHIPIFDEEGTLKGVLSVRNVVKLLAEHFPQEVLNLPPKLNNVPQTPEGG